MSRVHVERAASEDLPGIWAVYEDEARRASLFEAVEKRNCLVAKRGWDVIGYAVCEMQGFFGYPFLRWIAVAEADRRQGVGRGLVHYVLKTAPTDRIFASAPAADETGAAFLQAMAFEASGRVHNLHPDGEVERIFVRWVQGEAPE